MKIKRKFDKSDSSGSVPVFGSKTIKYSHMDVNTEFKMHFEAAEDKNYREILVNLADNIAEQGEKLYKRTDLKELKVYRNMISEFINIFTNSPHRFSKQSFLDRKGRHRVYIMIKKINEDIEKLAKDVLNEEKDNISILKRLDDIKGLILDMIM